VAFTCIHDASLAAVHVQSRDAVMLTLTVAPPGGTGADGPPSVVWHLTPSGPTNVSTVVSPPQEAAVAAAIAVTHATASLRAIADAGSRGYG